MQFVNASGKLSAPFYFWDNKPHECSQTWQVARSEFDQMMLDNAREHGVDRARRRARDRRPLRGRAARSASRIRDEDGTRREVRAKVVVDASGQAGLIQNRLRPARLGSRSSTRARSGPTGKAPTATPAATKARRWCCRPPAGTAGSGTSRCTTTSSSVGVVAPFDYLFKNRGVLRADLPGRSRALRRREAARLGRPPRHRLLCHEGLLVPRDTRRRRRLGDDRRRVGIPRSALFVGRAAGAESPASSLPTRSPRA